VLPALFEDSQGDLSRPDLASGGDTENFRLYFEERRTELLVDPSICHLLNAASSSLTSFLLLLSVGNSVVELLSFGNNCLDMCCI
jgi:hypothetical protein